MKTDGHKRFLKEKDEWKFQRKSPEPGAVYTWEDMLSVENGKDMEMIFCFIFITIMLLLALSAVVAAK